MKGLIYVLTLFVAFSTPAMCDSQTTAEIPGSSTELSRQAVGTSVEKDGEARSPVVKDDEVAPSTPQAKIIVDAPTRGKVGELIRFDLTKSTADSIKWLLRPESSDFESYDDGRKAVFSARTPGEYVFIIAVSKAGTVDVVTHTVTIEGPPEKPTTPDLALWIPYWLYNMQLPKEEALALAQGFELTASRITPLSTPEGIIKATSEANHAALGASIGAWQPLLVKLQAAMKNRAEAGQLVTPEQHKEMWLEIARGLRKYAE